MGRWKKLLDETLQSPQELGVTHVHLLSGFDNEGFAGLLTSYPPDHEMDLFAKYEGKDGQVAWMALPGVEGILSHPVDLGRFVTPVPWRVAYLYAEVESETAQMGHLCIDAPEKSDSPTVAWAWMNADKVTRPPA